LILIIPVAGDQNQFSQSMRAVSRKMGAHRAGDLLPGAKLLLGLGPRFDGFDANGLAFTRLADDLAIRPRPMGVFVVGEERDQHLTGLPRRKRFQRRGNEFLS
jgi:hypothetical protein